MNSTRLFSRLIASATHSPAIVPATARTNLSRTTFNQRLFHTTPARMTVHEVNTAEGFKAAIANNPKVLVDCFAEWCGPCKAIAPQVKKMSDAEEFKDIYFVKLDVDEVPELSQELDIRAMPTFLFFKDGEKVDSMLGAHPTKLTQFAQQHAA